MIVVEDAIDDIMRKGAGRLFERYLQPKVMPYAAGHARAICESLSNVSRLNSNFAHNKYSLIVHENGQRHGTHWSSISIIVGR